MDKNKESIKKNGSKCYINREISWLSFNLRVLCEADDNSVPVLERLGFLKIYQSNLDEFFMVRVGSMLHGRVLFPEYVDPVTGWDNSTQLRKTVKAVADQQKQVLSVYTHLLYDLRACGIEVVDYDHISKLDDSIAKKLFAEVRDQLSIRIVDSGHPMQLLGNCESYVAASLQKGDQKLIGIVSLYRVPRFRVYDSNGTAKVFMMPGLIKHFSRSVFKGYDVTESCLIRVTRNADTLMEEESEAATRSDKMSRLIKKRRRQQPVRLQLDCKPSSAFRQQLCEKIGISDRLVFVTRVPFDLGFSSLLGSRPALKYKPRKSVRRVDLNRGEYFDYLKKQDLLLSYPFNPMSSFIDILYEAAADPRVTRIQITLYRLAVSSQVAMALAYAADRGKRVDCLLELRARFDEKNNIDYSEMLGDAGCNIYYGLSGYKVHSKLCLITLQTPSGEEYITQVGTGNYNEITSELYTDLSLITSDRQVGQDAAAVFEALLEGQVPPLTKSLLMAPKGFKPALMTLLDEEMGKGSEGRVAIKVNALNDPDVMQKLMDCSRAGVKVELFIRGICCLRPGIEGYTDNISVKSVVGRHLEHSRIYVFGTGNDSKIYIGSGDLLTRNTQRRVEGFIPVSSPQSRRDVLQVMEAIREDGQKAWTMKSDGSYAKNPAQEGEVSQDRLYEYFARPLNAGTSEGKKSALKAVVAEEKRPFKGASRTENPVKGRIAPEKNGALGPACISRAEDRSEGSKIRKVTGPLTLRQRIGLRLLGLTPDELDLKNGDSDK